jgi:hypothetical protein
MGIGLSWPSKTIVGLSYALEFYPERQKIPMLIGYILMNGVMICGLPFYYSMHGDWYTI